MKGGAPKRLSSILFPTITIALGWVLLFFKLRFSTTGDQHWMDAYQFWVKVFALTFALGVVSGITMSFQFGTNWPGFMTTVDTIPPVLVKLWEPEAVNDDFYIAFFNEDHYDDPEVPGAESVKIELKDNEQGVEPDDLVDGEVYTFIVKIPCCVPDQIQHCRHADDFHHYYMPTDRTHHQV